MFYVWYYWQTWAADDCWRKPAGVWGIGWDLGVDYLIIHYPLRVLHYERVAMD